MKLMIRLEYHTLTGDIEVKIKIDVGRVIVVDVSNSAFYKRTVICKNSNIF